MDIKIMADASAEFSQEEIDKFGLTVFNQPAIFEGENEPTVDADEFWAKIADGKFAKTSQPSPEDFREQFQMAKDNGYAIILILISDKLSGTYDTACFIKEQVGYEHIYVINSLYATFAQKLLVYEAIRLKEKGLSAPEIVDKVTELRKRVTLYATPENLKHLALGGRISKATAMIGDLIKIKPIFNCNDEGHIVVNSKVLGLERTILKIVDKFITDKYDTNHPLFIFYSKDDANARKLIAKLRAKGIEINENYVMPVGSTIGTHFGIGTFGLAFVKERI